MSTFGIASKSSTTPHNREALLNILTTTATLMQALDGCCLYRVSKDIRNETDVWVMELWESEAAHDEAVSNPMIRDLIGRSLALMTNSPYACFEIPVGEKALIVHNRPM